MGAQWGNLFMGYFLKHLHGATSAACASEGKLEHPWAALLSLCPFCGTWTLSWRGQKMLVVSTDVLKLHYGHVLEMNMEIQLNTHCPGYPVDFQQTVV